MSKVKEFWEMLESNQFVKSTNSMIDEVEEFPPAIQDMEAVVKINGEFDKYAIDEWLLKQYEILSVQNNMWRLAITHLNKKDRDSVLDTFEKLMENHPINEL